VISHFFIDRPIFATVLSVVILIVGGVSLLQLPIAQYPEVAPPTVQVTAMYPGANAVTVADTVATPIETEVNGVERMLYMSSKCTNDGQMNLDVTFELGTNLDTAQVLVQNRVAIAQAKLPDEVKRIGVTTKKKSPSILLCVNLISPDGRYDQLYLTNFATLNVKDEIARTKGVGDVAFLGARDYSMRIWLDTAKLASLDMTTTDIIKAIQEQNVQVAAGRIGQPPLPANAVVPFDIPLSTTGRLLSPEQFEEIIVKTGDNGQNVFLRDVTRRPTYDKQGNVLLSGVELGAKSYDVNSYLGEGADKRYPAATLAVFQMPGSNALETAEAIKKKMEELKTRFPEGVEYRIVYDTTVFVQESILSVFHTLIEAFVLVFIVVLVFLQNWRATIIPMVAVPVSLIGTFAVMSAMGFSLNNLSLFGLVLAIGIVVDDAIVVVENVERLMAEGLSPRDASRKAMDEVTGPVVAIALVLCAVFVPTAFMAGISGEFFKQFALTIAASTVISAFNSLTLSPALCTLLLKPHKHGASHSEALPKVGVAIIGGLIGFFLLAAPAAKLLGMEAPAHGGGSGSNLLAVKVGLFAVGCIAGYFAGHLVNLLLGYFFLAFNKTFDFAINLYGKTVGMLLRLSVIVLLVYGGLIFLTLVGFRVVPVGFIPEQDKGYLVVNAQLPDGASLGRTDAVVSRLSEIARNTPGVAYTIDVPGYSTLLSTNISNVGGMFVILAPFEERSGKPELAAPRVIQELRARFAEVLEARTAVFGAPPVEGLGSTGGFKLQVQDRRGAGLSSLQGAVQNLSALGNQQPGLAGMFSSFSVTQPQLYIEIDREKAKSQGIALDDINRTLQASLGSFYVNDFTFQSRNWQVNVQADPSQRLRADEIGALEVRNSSGERVPLKTLINVRDIAGPAIVNHYNLFPSAEINGATAPGTSSGQAIALVNELARDNLPSTMGYEWTELTLQQILASEDLLTKLVFPLAVVFVVLVLAAQYESWSLPAAIVLIVPMCILAALAGIYLMGLDNNVFVQIGLVVLIGLAAKNAILIVEFAKQLEDQGKPRREATIEACRLRLRPILMTSFAFILGVVPLVLAQGAGAEMRQTLGIAVFSGMLGVTVFGIFFTPVFYSVVRWLTARNGKDGKPPSDGAHQTPPATGAAPAAAAPATAPTPAH
jgi:multidrug efflux pump